MESETAYIGLGSNLGDSLQLLKRALALIQQIPKVHFIRCSCFYLTSPISPISQPHFINAVCEVKSSLTPQELLLSLQKIELLLGKKAKPKEAPRLMDLDLLFFGKHFLMTPELQLPHPHWNERLFVLVPLFDLTPTIELPTEEGIKIVPLALLINQLQTTHPDQEIKKLSFT